MFGKRNSLLPNMNTRSKIQFGKKKYKFSKPIKSNNKAEVLDRTKFELHIRSQKKKET